MTVDELDLSVKYELSDVMKVRFKLEVEGLLGNGKGTPDGGTLGKVRAAQKPSSATLHLLLATGGAMLINWDTGW